MKEDQIRAAVCDVCHKIWQQGWAAANDGNVSVKMGEGRFLATPTGISKSMITPEMLVIINEKGELLQDADQKEKKYSAALEDLYSDSGRFRTDACNRSTQPE